MATADAASASEPASRSAKLERVFMETLPKVWPDFTGFARG
jgi:hypothetical protein